jgi:hypothetical protein
MKNVKVLAAVGLAVFGAGAAASADTVEMRFVSVGHARVVDVAGAYNGQLYAGELVHEFRNGTGEAAGLSGFIATFCTELTQQATDNWSLYTLTHPQSAPSPGVGMGAAKAEQLARLFEIAAGQQNQGADYAAAFQLMVWEIVYDYDASVAGTANLDRLAGDARFTGGDSHFGVVSVLFDGLRSSLLAASGAGMTDLRAVVNEGAQDQLVMMPLPSAGVLAGAGLLGLVGVRRRRA